MYRLKREDFLRRRFLVLWGLLGFQAGFINSFGFLACRRFVSHVTGFGTQVGLSLIDGSIWLTLQMCGTPLFFIFGSFVSGAFTIARIDRGKVPHYSFITYIIPALLGLCLVAGNSGFFGEFKEAFLHPHDFALLFLLSFICGVQNGCFATMTYGQIRTTHLTGISTDLGSDLSRMLFGKLPKEEAATLMRANILRLTILGTFAFGAIVSALVDDDLDYQALWVPMITSLSVCLAVNYIKRKLDLDWMLEKNALVQENT